MNSFSILSDNLISWWIQVSVIAVFGVALPYLFRIRHSRTQLVFYHLILVVCVLLPLIEPWQHPLLVASGTDRDAPNTAAGIPWGSFLVWIIAAGIFAKLCWLAAGLWHIRRYRASAMPVFPVSESIRQARILTHADARFGISRNVDSPATLGHVDPIILLPESFLIMDHDAQLSIVCHELIHVRRNDWLVTLFEEFIGILFWFNPAVWLLLSQTKLSREQLVDTEVVALTEAPAPYVHALLAMAGVPRKIKTVAAAFFLTDGHLPHRIRALLTSRRGSAARLFVSYVSIGCLLAMFVWSATVWFPLVGEAQTAEKFMQHQLLPPVRIERTNPRPAAGAASSTFNVRVPVSPDASKDTVYYVSGIATGPELQDQTTTLHDPPPPMFQPFQKFESQGVRMVRPGDRVTPEDIARMQAVLGERALIEVTQADDGTVQRIKIQRRRSPDEISVGPFRLGFGPGDINPAAATGTLDSVH